jgi:hypothetical protein
MNLPETRIRVEHSNLVCKYYPEYKEYVLPVVRWFVEEWYSISPFAYSGYYNIREHVRVKPRLDRHSLDDAKKAIDEHLDECRLREQLAQAKAVTKTTYIKYPYLTLRTN